jgi:hypothetical protein
VPDRPHEDVRQAAAAALLDFLSFDRMPLATPVHKSQVVAVLQATDGVLGVDLDLFHYRGFAGWSPAALAARGATADPVQPHLRIFAARSPGEAAADPLAAAILAAVPPPEVVPAEQAVADADDIVLTAEGGIG